MSIKKVIEANRRVLENVALDKELATALEASIAKAQAKFSRAASRRMAGSVALEKGLATAISLPINWALYLPPFVLPDTGPKTFAVGQVWATNLGNSYAAVFRIMRADVGADTWRVSGLAGDANEYDMLFFANNFDRGARFICITDSGEHPPEPEAIWLRAYGQCKGIFMGDRDYQACKGYKEHPDACSTYSAALQLADTSNNAQKAGLVVPCALAPCARPSRTGAPRDFCIECYERTGMATIKSKQKRTRQIDWGDNEITHIAIDECSSLNLNQCVTCSVVIPPTMKVCELCEAKLIPLQAPPPQRILPYTPRDTLREAVRGHLIAGMRDRTGRE